MASEAVHHVCLVQNCSRKTEVLVFPSGKTLMFFPFYNEGNKGVGAI